MSGLQWQSNGTSPHGLSGRALQGHQCQNGILYEMYGICKIKKITQIQEFVDITKPLWPLQMLLLLKPLVPLGALTTGVAFLPVGALCRGSIWPRTRGSPLHSSLPIWSRAWLLTVLKPPLAQGTPLWVRTQLWGWGGVDGRGQEIIRAEAQRH